MIWCEKVNRTFARLEQELERDPSVYEVAEVLQTRPYLIAKEVEIICRGGELFAPYSADETQSLEEVMKRQALNNQSNDYFLHEFIRVELEKVLGTLESKQRAVLVLCFGIGLDEVMPAAEVARMLGLSRERIRQIKEKALEKLKKKFEKTLRQKFEI
jgi:RNA polymerase primary sigma factor